MNFSLLHNLQLNREQITLCESQQHQLLKVIGKLLSANYNPHEGSLLIVRTWADGTFEELLSGDLMLGKASNCHTQKLKGDYLVNDSRYSSAEYVGHEVSEAIRCSTPGAFYYGKIDSNVGRIYAKQGHYVLSLPLNNGRIIASFRANYCWHHHNMTSSISEPWQHRLMLTGLAEAFCLVMPQEERLADSFEEILASYCERERACYTVNSGLIQRCLAHRPEEEICKVVNINNSKLPTTWRAVAYA